MPNPATDTRTDYRARSEYFDVVLVKNGVQSWAAKPDEFRRVSVTASEPTTARDHADVAAAVAQGWTVHRVMGPGALSPEEIDARSRSALAPTTPKDLPAPSPDRSSRRAAPLDVVMTKAGVSSLSAKPDEFRRVSISAADGSEARHHPDVVKAESEGWTVNQIVMPGVKTQDEHAAETRAYTETMGPSLRDR